MGRDLSCASILFELGGIWPRARSIATAIATVAKPSGKDGFDPTESLPVRQEAQRQHPPG